MARELAATASEMPDNDRKHGGAESPYDPVPQRALKQGKKADPDRLIVGQEKRKAQLSNLRTVGFQQAQARFDAAGDDGGEGGATDLHGGESQKTVDEQRIADQVQNDRGGTESRAFGHAVRIFHNGEIRRGQAHEQIGETHDPQVLPAEFDENGLIGEYFHEDARHRKGGKKKDKADGEGELFRKGQCFLHGEDILFAPVLGGHGGCNYIEENKKNVQDKMDLGRQGDRRESVLREHAQHQGVGCLDKLREKRLQGDRDCNRKYSAVKCFMI